MKLDKCNVKGYMVWFFMDNLEWWVGYLEKFGLYYVNFSDLNRLCIGKLFVEFFWYVVKDYGFF